MRVSTQHPLTALRLREPASSALCDSICANAESSPAPDTLRFERRTASSPPSRARQIEAARIGAGALFAACSRPPCRYPRTMRSPALIAAAIVIFAVAVALIGEALSFSSAAYLAALVIGLLAISMIDRDRFWGADLRRTRAPR